MDCDLRMRHIEYMGLFSRILNVDCSGFEWSVDFTALMQSLGHNSLLPPGHLFQNGELSLLAPFLTLEMTSDISDFYI